MAHAKPVKQHPDLCATTHSVLSKLVKAFALGLFSVNTVDAALKPSVLI